MVRILGWFLSEGNCYKGKVNHFINITQKKKENVIKITNILDRLGYKYKTTISKSQVYKFEICNKQLFYELKKYGIYAKNKRVPKYVFELDKDQIRIFLNSYLLGDGTVHKNNNEFFTSSKGMADDLQELILRCKSYASITKVANAGSQFVIEGRIATRTADTYVVREYSKITDICIIKSNLKEIQYNGYVYCVNVEPYHLIYTRRNGKCLWTGNSGIGVTDRGRKIGLPIVAVNFGKSASQKKRFSNLRAECWWRVRELLREGKMELPKDRLLEGDLVAPKFGPDDYGRIILESKDDIRARINRSPDSGDSLALTYALPVSEFEDEDIKRVQDYLTDGEAWKGSRWVIAMDSKPISRWKK